MTEKPPNVVWRGFAPTVGALTFRVAVKAARGGSPVAHITPPDSLGEVLRDILAIHDFPVDIEVSLVNGQALVQLIRPPREKETDDD